MAGETQITVVGNLTGDPELRYTSSSVPVASFTVASTPRTYNRQSGQWEDGTAMFLRCSAWREMAENIAETCSKGMRVIVTGRLTQRNWQNKQGENRSSLEIQVDEIGPSLRYAQAQVNRISRGQGGGGFSNQSAPAGGFNQGGAPQGGGQGGFGGPQNGTNDDPWATSGSSFDDNNPPF